jgi:alpha-L-rhamnosidase
VKRVKLVAVGAIAVVLSSIPTVAGGAPGATPDQSAVQVGPLTTEGSRNPLGVDVVRPRLSWVLESSERGQAQTAYQVLVSSSLAGLGQARGDAWDSGKVASDQSVSVSYGGHALASSTRYYWKVRVWDVHGIPSDWSAPAWWETALLHPSDWTAAWIGPPVFDAKPDLAGANWIWYPEGDPAQSAPGGTRYFRSQFDLPGDRDVTSATLTVTADNQVTAYVNGGQVSTGADWIHASRLDVAASLRTGKKVLAFSASNIDGPAGLIARLRISFASGDPLIIDTTRAVKSANAESAGWQAPDFDDSSWPPALEIATYGDPPWGLQVTVPRPSPAAGPLLRKEFAATAPISRARAYISGIGYYVLRINGRKVGDRVLDPTYTEYEDTVLYSTYDVTTFLRTGPNAIGVELSPGFYYYDTPKLRMQLVIDYADGTSEMVGTDGTWRLSTSGPTLFGTDGAEPVFGGETFDARRDPRGWDQTGFDTSGWQPAAAVAPPGGKLVAEAVEPVTVAENVDPVGVTQPRTGTYVVDMGRTLTGWVRLAAAGQAGTKVSIQYGEKLNPDGTVNAVASPGPRPRWQRDEYIFRSSDVETWEPSFTFKSFHYVQLDGLSAPPQQGAVLGRAVHSSVRSIGDFSSSDALYNQIHQAMRRTTLDALLGYPAIDPAHEKNGWAGDTQLITPSMTDNFGMNAFLAKWLGDVRDSERADGSISQIDPIRDDCCYGWAPEWTAAYPLVAWELYVKYGDRQVLESHYDTLVKYMQWQTGSLVDGIAPASMWGDWASPGYGVGPEDRRLSATAYVYRQAIVMAGIAAALGHTEDADRYTATAGSIRARFNEAFLDNASGEYKTASDPGYRQASNAIPLAFGMVPEEYRRSVLDGLVRDVLAHDRHLNTGILGTPALLDVLTRNGHADLAQAAVDQTTYPSWGEWIRAGADTMWEGWGLDGRSRNHPMLGTVDAWFYQDVVGISPDPQFPGFKHTIIQPFPMAAPSHATASYDSVYGQIEATWTASADGFSLDVHIPVNTSATVLVPVGNSPTVLESGRPAGAAPGVESLGIADGYARFCVGSGDYHFSR